MYIVKRLDGKLYACIGGIGVDTYLNIRDEVWVERVESKTRKTNDGKLYLDGGRIVIYKKAYYTGVYDHRLDGNHRIGTARNFEDGIDSAPFARDCYKAVAEISENFAQYEDVEVTEECFNELLNPYSDFVKSLVEIFNKYGDQWKDETMQIHIDDINPYEIATEIEQRLKDGSLILNLEENGKIKEPCRDPITEQS